MTDVEYHRMAAGAGSICDAILATLPEWFGLPESNASYIEAADHEPTVVATIGDRPAGFLTIRRHTPQASEVLVMGVDRDLHRGGIGTGLLADAEAWLRTDGVDYLQVKTLAATHPDEHYRATRAFYRSRGFVDLEVIPELWDVSNPALVMVKKL